MSSVKYDFMIISRDVWDSCRDHVKNDLIIGYQGKQATRRLGKDQTELKRMRHEKEDADNVHQEKQMLEETTMERIIEMERALVNTNSMGETINSLLNTLEMDNV
uniref:Uncharacterized protein n=1 Tax=Solanum lycopersicum TaxID=4081 RepID=K4D0L8_SOLLC